MTPGFDKLTAAKTSPMEPAGSGSTALDLQIRGFVRGADLFSFVMALRPVVKPNYFKVKAEGDSCIAK
ncbi:hypothetical protein O1611_g5502 [Lasiodiplodia mahajangana]|uniref:Uncharacterized protein n=1 Tax=Lasiodiplodia mahajangana TaxID=1108764 RepID=A0ACC2JLB0_9PEZI|nr:hypothetical protein O1611_g5502 [Lasiodiplodia mahajangana]